MGDLNEVDRLAQVYAEATGYYVPFHRGLSSPSADKIREGIRAVLAATRTPDAAGGWEAIESAPRDGTRILLIGHRGDQIDIGEYGAHGRYLGKVQGYEVCWSTAPGYKVTPTHWRPLPAPPSDAQAGEGVSDV